MLMAHSCTFFVKFSASNSKTCCLYSNKKQKSLCEKTCIVYKVLGVFSFMAIVFWLHLSDFHKSFKVLFV